VHFRRARSRSEEVFINLTPLIDVVFLLLIFFMVTTTFATIRYGMRVDLPTTTTPQEKIKQNIVVSINKDGKIYLGKKWVSEKQLVSLLRQEIKKKGTLVIVNADRNVLHGKVVRVMDLAKKAGAQKLGILTTPEKEK